MTAAEQTLAWIYATDLDTIGRALGAAGVNTRARAWLLRVFARHVHHDRRYLYLHAIPGLGVASQRHLIAAYRTTTGENP